MRSIRRTIAFFATAWCLLPPAAGQPVADVPAQIAAIDRIAWLVGSSST